MSCSLSLYRISFTVGILKYTCYVFLIGFLTATVGALLSCCELHKTRMGLQNPLIVVLDSQGMVRKSNAMDMVFIWGARAYPFSTSKEKELRDEENWTLKLLLDEIDPLLTTWV